VEQGAGVPLAETTAELRFTIPAWGSALLVLIGVVYLVFGTWWRRAFDVLSMTVLGGVVGLVVGSRATVPVPVLVILGGLVLGGLTAVFGRVLHVVLAAFVLATILAVGAALVVGPGGFTSYVVMGTAESGSGVHLIGPNLARDAVLAAALAGLAGGVAVAVALFQFSERLATCVQGAALVVLAAAALGTRMRSDSLPPLTTAYPLTLSVIWIGLVAAGLAVQTGLSRRRAAVSEASLPPAESEPDMETDS
jgi:hypothetical protein